MMIPRLMPGALLRRVGAIVPVVVLSLSSPAAHADSFGFSLAGGAADGRVDCLDGFACDHHAGYLKVGADYRGLDPLDVQIAYFHVGDLEGADTTPLGTKFGGTFRTSGVALTAGYRWAFAPDLAVVPRGGVAIVRTRFTYDNPFQGDPSKTRVQPYGSLGLDYSLAPNWDVGLDYTLTRLQAHTYRGTLQIIGASVQFHF